MTMRLKSMGLAVAVGMLAIALGVPADAQPKYSFKAAHTNAVGEIQDEGLKFMKKRLEELTNGQATIEIFANGVLGTEIPAIEGVLLGTIDMTVPSNAAFSNFVPEMKIFDMPFLFKDIPHMDRAVSGPMFAELVPVAQKKGFHLLGIYSSGIRHIMTKEPIRSMDDLKGKKIRTMQNPVHVEAFKAFGANATAMSYGELYGAIQVGVVDGAEAANSNYTAQKFYEVAKNWAMVGWLNLTAPVVISEKKFASLPANIQAALVRAGLESAVWERQFTMDQDKLFLDRIKAQGVNITTPDATPFRKASQAVYDKFLTSPLDKKLLGYVQQTQ